MLMEFPMLLSRYTWATFRKKNLLKKSFTSCEKNKQTKHVRFFFKNPFKLTFYLTFVIGCELQLVRNQPSDRWGMSRLHLTVLSVVFLARSKTILLVPWKGIFQRVECYFLGCTVVILLSLDKERRFQRKASEFLNLHSSVDPQDLRSPGTSYWA